MIRNVVFMGTPDFAVGTLQALIDSPRYHLQAVFSQPDRPKGRRQLLEPTPVKAAALQAGIPVYQPVKIRQPQWLEVLRELHPDVIVVVAFGQLIPQAVLDLPRYGCINVHASLLPKYRGAAPIQWAVIDGEKESGVTTMRMDAGLDTGDMILKRVVPIGEKETGGSLFEKLSAVGASALLETLEAIESGEAVYEKQPAESPTMYAAMLKKEDGHICWEKSAASIDCLVRGTNPWPGAWTRHEGKLWKIWAVQAENAVPQDLQTGSPEEKAFAPQSTETGSPEEKALAPQSPQAGSQKGENAGISGAESSPEHGARKPGTICEVTKNTLKVLTGDGIVSILELQPEGKKRMTVDAFLRGCRVCEGDCLS